MLWLTRFDGTRFVLNADLIEMMEQTPDTVITLTNGHHLVVRESVENILRELVSFRQQALTPAGNLR
jgi:flagellar protein FlbD